MLVNKHHHEDKGTQLTDSGENYEAELDEKGQGYWICSALHKYGLYVRMTRKKPLLKEAKNKTSFIFSKAS